MPGLGVNNHGDRKFCFCRVVGTPSKWPLMAHTGHYMGSLNGVIKWNPFWGGWNVWVGSITTSLLTLDMQANTSWGLVSGLPKHIQDIFSWRAWMSRVCRRFGIDHFIKRSRKSWTLPGILDFDVQMVLLFNAWLDWFIFFEARWTLCSSKKNINFISCS